MTARLSPQREAEIVEWRDLLGASHCAEDAGPHGALNDLLAELAAVRAERDESQQQLAEYEPLNPQQCPAGKHTDWLVDSEYTHACPWCRIDELKEEAAFVERCTLPDLRRDVDHHKGGKDRWRTRAEKAEATLAALHAAGVDNWEGYDEAVTS